MELEELSANVSEKISFTDFLQVDLRVGQILEAKINSKAKNPAYLLTIDFGHLGCKISSAQITQNYSTEELVGKQVIAVVNLPPKRIAGVKSEVLVLAAVCSTHGTVILEPNMSVINGSRIS